MKQMAETEKNIKEHLIKKQKKKKKKGREDIKGHMGWQG